MSLKRRLITNIKLVVMVLLVATIINPLIPAMSAKARPSQLVYDMYEELVSFERQQLLVKINTSKVALLLNEMLHVNNTSRLSLLANNVSSLLNSLSSEYDSLYLIELAKIVSFIMILLVAIVLLYKYRRALAIRVWWFLHKDDIVVKPSSKKRVDTLQEYIVFLVIVLIVVAVIGVAQYVHITSASFTELLLLGKNNTLSDYPSIVPVGDNVTFTIAISNHLGYTGFYKILVKIDKGENNLSASSPAAVKVLREYYVIIPNSAQTIIKVPITFNQSSRYRLIFELWRYDTTRHDFVYDGIWVHKWVEIVKP